MFDVDIAIKNEKEDVLNRGRFAEKLARSIMDYLEPYPLTIGLNGTWGSGKTSIINLTLDYIEKNYVDDEYVIVHFNPWFFSNQKNLFLQFFKLIIDALKNKKTENESIVSRTMNPKRTIFKKTEIEALEEYSNYIQFNLDDANEYQKVSPQTDATDSLAFYKEQCDNYFEKLNFKVIVVIDDIERLLNSEINQIFTLVKSLANFKNFIYLLSFDKNIVATSLNDLHSEQGDNFIDKIIQIPIVIPTVSESKLDELIQNNLEPIYTNYLKDDFINHYDEFIEVSNFLNLFINDIRDLKKFMNLLNFYWDIFVKELNINDFILMLAIQLFEYDLFLKIKKHKDLLTANKALFQLKDNSIKEEILKVLTYFEENESYTSKKLKNLLIFLFPILDGSPAQYEQWDLKFRVCSNKHFDNYFLLSLESNEVSKLLLDKLVEMDNENEIYEIFTQENNPDYNHSLIYQFSKLISKIPPQNSSYFIKALLRCGDEIDMHPDSRRRFNIILNQLFEKIDDSDKCYELLEESANHENNLLTHCQYVYSLTYQSKVVKKELCIGMTEIESIKEQSVNKIHKSAQSKEFLNHQNLQDVLTYWKLLDEKENVNTYILSNVNTNEEVLSFLSKFQTNTRSKFTFDFDKLEEYHGLDFYETKLNEILVIENLNPEVKEFCEIFLNESRQYKKDS